MIQIPAFIITAGKALLMKKVTEELDRGIDNVVNKTVANDDNESFEIVKTEKKELHVYSKNKIVSLGLTATVGTVYILSASGVISPEVAELINALLTSEATVDAIEGIVE